MGFEKIPSIVTMNMGITAAVKRPGKFVLFPLAIFLHAFLNLFAALYQKQIIKSLFVTEGILILITAGVISMAYRMYRKDEQNLLHM